MSQFTCKHCEQSHDVIREAGVLKLEPHRYQEPEGQGTMFYRCEGSDGPASENVVEIMRLRTLEAELAGTRPTPRKNDSEVSDMQNDAIQRRFEQYHEQNPKVLATLAEISLRMKDEGRQRLSISELFEKLRYEKRMHVDTADEFKFSNDYRSRYVRLLVKTFPELAGLFELRELRSVNGRQPADV